MQRNPGLDALAAEIYANMMARDPRQDALRAAEVSFLSASAFEVVRLARTKDEAVVHVPREVVTQVLEALDDAAEELAADATLREKIAHAYAALNGVAK